MPLPKNQIDTLFIWVHPDFCPVDDHTRLSWRTLVELLETEDHCALIETRNFSSELNAATIERIIRKSGWDTEGYSFAYQREHLRELAEIENEAKKRLGERYRLWHRNFVVSNASDYVSRGEEGDDRFVKEMFNIKERLLDNYFYPKLFRWIWCYGLLPDVCVDHQAYTMALCNWTHHTRSSGTNPLSARGVIFPTNLNTVQTMKKQHEKYQIWNDHDLNFLEKYFREINRTGITTSVVNL